MKKIMITLPILVGMIFLAGCGKKNETTSMVENNNPTVEKKNETKGDSMADKVVGGLKDMLLAGKTMECSTSSDGVDTKVYIQGTKYKSVTASKEMNVIGIFDNEAFYSWDVRTKAGTKMTMACMKELEKNMPENQNAPNEEGFASTDKIIEEESKKNNCKETSENIDFSVPSDINFVDQCLMMQNFSKEMKDFKMPVK